ncbi:MAG: DoxX family protein, partial [Ralstonia sp.]
MDAAIERWRDELLLLGRVLLMLLFLISGWGKITGFQATVGFMCTVGAPMPMLAAIIAVIMEFGVGIALLIVAYFVWRYGGFGGGGEPTIKEGTTNRWRINVG